VAKPNPCTRTNGAVSDEINRNNPGPNQKNTELTSTSLAEDFGLERISRVAGRTLGADQKSPMKTNWHRTEATAERIARGARLRKPKEADTS
jgi:hypothetical protein